MNTYTRTVSTILLKDRKQSRKRVGAIGKCITTCN